VIGEGVQSLLGHGVDVGIATSTALHRRPDGPIIEGQDPCADEQEAESIAGSTANREVTSAFEGSHPSTIGVKHLLC
jgi:hypothetical protein